MFVLKLYNYINGYYLIEIKGKMPERFINLLNNNNISVWDIKKTWGLVQEKKNYI